MTRQPLQAVIVQGMKDVIKKTKEQIKLQSESNTLSIVFTDSVVSYNNLSRDMAVIK